MSESGSSCPTAYRYEASAFRTAPCDPVETAYVVGGLYGNVEALHAILRMRDAETKQGPRVTLVFNGDFNWFDVDTPSFDEINQVAIDNLSIRGNVEAEISEPTDTGCGCNYPDYVNAGIVAHSNAIMLRLQETASRSPALRDVLKKLPMFRVLDIGNTRVGIVHGDAEMLAGWDFAAERLSPIDRCGSGNEAPGRRTSIETIERYFLESGVHAFASTHTCLPYARDYRVGDRDRLIINNGAAGLPNFAHSSFGLITRISVVPAVPADSLYGIKIDGVRFDALPVRYDQSAWIGRFLGNWAPGSPAYEAYFHRIVAGPNFDLRDAIGGNVAMTHR